MSSRPQTPSTFEFSAIAENEPAIQSGIMQTAAEILGLPRHVRVGFVVNLQQQLAMGPIGQLCQPILKWSR
jgi:hypothetical protein